MRIAFTLGAAKKASLALLLSFGVLALGTASAVAEETPRVPEEVAQYFSTELIPRLADLYGPGVDGRSGIQFDESTTVGTITRVMVWTDDFRAGRHTDQAVQASNSWVAPVAGGESDDPASEVAQLGLATVWINPNSNLPELADFVPSETLGPALAEAPEGAMLVHDAEQRSWFALIGDELTPLAQGTDAVTGSRISLAAAQESLWRELETLPEPRTNNGFVVAGLTLAFVVVLLAVFVLVPDRRRSVVDPEVALGFAPRSLDRD